MAMHVLGVSKTFATAKNRRLPTNHNKNWKVYFFNDETHKFGSKKVDAIHAKILSFQKEHRLIKECAYCKSRGQYITKKKNTPWECPKCFNINK